ncbi:GNAT family N-acetyltransferase [Cellulomonas taurus]|uniref:GNAT family N-acetyltransferase n=1 Tax=Cellulomonas taurus TaxID=2729175 RepID=UPI00145EF8C8|nr:GNAT family N-acetyltransferase [Cellulomonas taurus]
MLPDEYRLISVPESRLPEFREVDEFGFAEHLDEDILQHLTFGIPFDRTRAVERDGQLVAVHGSYPFQLSVPGGTQPCAGLSWVAVRPDHRRRGLLRAMIQDHLTRSIARGESVSALFAAEPAIYGRFGYGSASDVLRLTLPRGAKLRDIPGSDELTVRFETADRDRHLTDLLALQETIQRDRPGWVNRSTEGLRRNLLTDPPGWREGAEPLRVVTVRRGEELVGYALVARKEKWDEADNPAHTANVRSHGALDPAATHRLWSFLLDLDLVATVTTAVAVDDVLTQLLVDQRRAKPLLIDNLWVRVLDLPAALQGRRYATDLDLVLGVRDSLLSANQGSWRLTVTDGTATVTRTEDAPQLSLDIRELGALLLGGRSVAAMARAGLVEAADPAVLPVADTAFGWHAAPHTPWGF